MGSEGARPWSAAVRLEDVPETGQHVVLEAEAATRAEVAKAAGVEAIDRLNASFDLVRQGTGLHAVGQVSAQVRQTCVVSLEPVVNQVEEAIDLTFLPETAVPAPEEADTEPPEALVNGMVDLGAVATEFLLLGIDPYPRKPGVKFEPPVAAADVAAHPFAALEALKKGGRVKG